MYCFFRLLSLIMTFLFLGLSCQALFLLSSLDALVLLHISAFDLERAGSFL